MTRVVWLSLLFSAVLLAQQPADPANPFPAHEPPDGWFCVTANSAQDVATHEHACSCLGMTLDPVCGTPEENHARQDSNKCKAWCRLDACKCGGCKKDSN